MATPNVCAGPFGALYDFYIERSWLMRLIGHAVWGIDASVLYEAIAPVAEAEDITIIDVPCGGGVALRALRPDQRVRYIAGDISPKMLRRAERRARLRSLRQVELVEADMLNMPFADGEADLMLCFSGLHMVSDPQRAIEELARCVKPAGRLIGTAFVDDMSVRGRLMFGAGTLRGHPFPPRRADLEEWMRGAGLADPVIGAERGFVTFSAGKPET